MQITGLGYEAEYFTLDDHDVVHAAVDYVDPLVRAGAPVWLPNLSPAPLCGLGRGARSRRIVGRTSGPLCRRCADHLRDLDEWVRQAELRLAAFSAPVPIGGNGGGNGNGNGKGSASSGPAANGPAPPPRNRLHQLPF